ncbi:hypothetical protein AURDEDRAFT_122215 [Auricularia subglabra TFB-10046 SS5]|nr:hypothetical protein AURDEDRAFT_122215 [Auricularia subglabra TFB-10046 SS5]
MGPAATLLPELLDLIFNEIYHEDFMPLAGVSRHWRAAAIAHPNFFRDISLCDMSRSSEYDLETRVEYWRFLTVLDDCARHRVMPLAVLLDLRERNDFIAKNLLPALRAAMPSIVYLELRLSPLYSATEVLAPAPRLRHLVIGTPTPVISWRADGAPAFTVPADIFVGEAPRLLSVQLRDGAIVDPAAPPRAFAGVPLTVMRTQELSMLENINIDRARKRGTRKTGTSLWFDWHVPPVSRNPRRDWRRLRHSADRGAPRLPENSGEDEGERAAPVLATRDHSYGGSIDRLRIESPFLLVLKPNEHSERIVRANYEPTGDRTPDPDCSNPLLAAVTQVMRHGTISSLEIDVGAFSRFLSCFADVELSDTQCIVIFYEGRRKPDVALRQLLDSLPELAVARSPKCSGLCMLMIPWRCKPGREPVMTTDEALRLASALGTSSLAHRVRLRLRGVELVRLADADLLAFAKTFDY